MAGVKGLANPEGAYHCFLNVAIEVRHEKWPADVIKVLFSLKPFRDCLLRIGAHSCRGAACTLCGIQASGVSCLSSPRRQYLCSWSIVRMTPSLPILCESHWLWHMR